MPDEVKKKKKKKKLDSEVSKTTKANRKRYKKKQTPLEKEQKRKITVQSMSLEDERAICKNLVIYGEHIFDDMGWDYASKRNFLSMKRVKKEITKNVKLYNNREQLEERSTFYHKLEILKMVPASLNIVARSLKGDYKDEKTGKKVYAPTVSQTQTAFDVLAITGVEKHKSFTDDKMVINIDNRQVTLGASSGSSMGGSDVNSIHKRDRVRSAVEKMLQDLTGTGSVTKEQVKELLVEAKTVEDEKEKEEREF